jgi:hypothetical protein
VMGIQAADYTHFCGSPTDSRRGVPKSAQAN